MLLWRVYSKDRERSGVMRRLFLFLFLWTVCFTAGAEETVPVSGGERSFPENHEKMETENGEDRFFILTWKENKEAVWYDLQIFPEEEFFGRKEMKPPVYTNSHVFRNGIILPGSIFSSYKGRGGLYFRVRGIGLDGAVISDFSLPCSLKKAARFLPEPAPLPRVHYHEGNGTNLLYPAYSFVPVPGAAAYEVEVAGEKTAEETGEMFDDPVYRDVVTSPDLFDPFPRIGTFYWRVRGLDEAGEPLGTWSKPQKIGNDPSEKREVGILGDSISHGGGRMAYSPADWSYNYAAYLDFPVMNFSRSGDETSMMAERFARDVLPFHVRYLLILGGTNNLRLGKSADSVISDLRTIGNMCREADIVPVFLTIPPIDPLRIEMYHHQKTAEDWKSSFQKVNDWIRGELHIDTALPFESYETMPAGLAADGLHPDAKAKEMMAAVINREMKKIMAAETEKKQSVSAEKRGKT